MLDTTFIAQFMATYRTFMSARQLMELLIMRYTLPRPKDRSALEKFKQAKEIPIQLRYHSFLTASIGSPAVALWFFA
jgi:hypothetical protein